MPRKSETLSMKYNPFYSCSWRDEWLRALCPLHAGLCATPRWRFWREYLKALGESSGWRGKHKRNAKSFQIRRPQEERCILCIFLKSNLLKRSRSGNNDKMEKRICHSLKAAGGGEREDEARVLISESVPNSKTRREGGRNHRNREQSEELVCTPEAAAILKVVGPRQWDIIFQSHLRNHLQDASLR